MMGYLSILLFSTSLILTMTNGQETYGECAPPCKCKWMDGKKGADCSKSNYTYIPNYLVPEVQIFDLSGNKIKHLKENAFSQVGLVNLHKLILRDCKIQDIDNDAFKELKIMIELDLSKNNIRELYPGTFDSTEKLRILLLNNNYIKNLENNLFHNLIHLQTVDLSNNNIDTIADRTFNNLTNFKALKINSNNLTNLKPSTFEHLENLYTLELDGNPWNCNCDLKNFSNWSILRKLYTAPTKCNEPSYLHNKLWNEIPSDEFACHPNIIKIGPSKNIELVQGDSITLWCNGYGIPKPQLTWSHNSKLITNSTTHLNYEKKYIINENNDWSNLTILSVDINIDRGDYICIATNYGGTDKENINLSIIPSSIANRNTFFGNTLLLSLAILLLLLALFSLALVIWYCRKKNIRHDEKSIEVTSLENHGMGEQEKSLITSVNPVVKPPRRYDAPSSVTSHGTDMTDVNRTLLDNDSVFADGVGSVIGIIGGISEDEGEQACTPEAETISLAHGKNYRHYPPDLLAFSGGRGASPSSQSSIIPEQLNIVGTPTRLINHHIDFGSPVSGKYPASFKTLPHNKSSNLSYNNNNTSGSTILPRQGYVTIPRRPRAPSWSSGPPTSPLSPIDIIEPVYDNLGLRTTADGSSVLSLNKSPEPTYSSMRMRPLPVTPSTPTSTTPTKHYNTIQRSTPNIINDNNNIDRSAPEGASEWSSKQDDNQIISDVNGTLGRKVPPRPPPKPKKKNNKKINNGPLYEDEGEDGTEV